MSRTIVLAVAAVSLLLAACSPQEPEIAVEEQIPADQRGDDTGDGADDGDAGEPAGETVTITAVDLGFEGVPASLEPGSYTFELDNTGSLEHNIVVEELGDELVVEAMGGDSATGTVALDEPGTYTIYCSIPGHRSSMEATIEVG